MDWGLGIGDPADHASDAERVSDDAQASETPLAPNTQHPDPEREAGLAERLEASAPGARRYAVKAVWKTLQGEGFWAGRPAVFVRLAGCNMWDGEPDHRERDFARTGAACSLFCDTDFRKRAAYG